MNCILKLGIPLEELKAKIFEHADFGSLLAIYDTFEQFNLVVDAFINEDKDLEKATFPFIGQVQRKDSKYFVVLKKVQDNKIVMYDEHNRKQSISKEEFLNIWTGVYVYVHPSTKVKISNTNTSRDRRILSFITLALLTILVIVPISHFLGSEKAMFLLPYFVLKVIGLLVTLGLLWYEVDKFNPVLKNICSGGKKVNCSSVLNSEKSTFFGGLFSWSEAGFVYFFASLTYLLINYQHLENLNLLYLLSLSSTVIVVYSLFTQGFILKQWCFLCILVQLVLVGEVLLVYSFYNLEISFPTNGIAILVFLLLCSLTLLFWRKIESSIIKKKKNTFNLRKLNRIKSNKQIFNYLLKNSQPIRKLNNLESVGMKFGNESASIKVVKVCNPYCGPCSRVHPTLDKLLEDNIINLQIIFNSKSDLNNEFYLPSFHFLTLYEENKSLAHEALNFWYSLEEKNYKLLKVKFPTNNLLSQKDNIELMDNWCNLNEITHTPTIYINGFRLPKEYSVDDLVLLL